MRQKTKTLKFQDKHAPPVCCYDSRPRVPFVAVPGNMSALGTPYPTHPRLLLDGKYERTRDVLVWSYSKTNNTNKLNARHKRLITSQLLRRVTRVKYAAIGCIYLRHLKPGNGERPRLSIPGHPLVRREQPPPAEDGHTARIVAAGHQVSRPAISSIAVDVANRSGCK